METTRAHRDPFLQAIRDGLAGKLDEDLFQTATIQLLAREIPGIVPITPRGKDSGRDGAVFDGEAEAFPAVCTTAKDFGRNLQKSLDSYLKAGLPRRKVILVTSREVSPQARTRLEKTARERDFTLVQIFDRERLAELLYRDSRWCSQLLGLSAPPPALAAVPTNHRPFFEIELIGREADLEWLNTTAGDRIVSGQPGSGKTFLLHRWAAGAEALFVESDDAERIGGEIRDRQPKVLIVDDAHVKLERIETLQRIRLHGNHDFSVLAVTWPGACDDLAERLGSLPSSQIRKLELLTRDHLVNLYSLTGIDEEALRRQGFLDPSSILRDLVTQAANKPGLAATLASLVLVGEWKEVLSGTRLRRHLVSSFTSLAGEEAETLLGCFAVGGTAGFTIEEVATFLEKDRASVGRATASMAHGGVLTQLHDHRLRVDPEPLRSSLIAANFLRAETPGLDLRPLLAQAANEDSATEALLLAALRARTEEVPIHPPEELRERVATSSSPQVWNAWMQFRPGDTHWVLDNAPSPLDLTPVALKVTPEVAIPFLLAAAEEASGPLHSQPHHPLRILQDWMQEGLVEGSEPLRRRKLVARKAERYHQRGGDYDIAVRALLATLSPSLKVVENDPGYGSRVTMGWGLLSGSALDQLGEIWRRHRALIDRLDPDLLRRVIETVENLRIPDRVAPATLPEEEIQAEMDRLAMEILQDLAPLAMDSVGAAAALQRLARRLDSTLDLPLDPDFEHLYPDDSHDNPENWQERQQERADAVEELARQWHRREPEPVAARLAEVEKEAQWLERQWPRLTPHLSWNLAAMVPQPEEWLASFISADLPGDLVVPFAEGLQDKGTSAEDSLARMLEKEELARYAVDLILKIDSPPAWLLERALGHPQILPNSVDTLVHRNEVPLPTLLRLLEHPNREIATSAAVGEWTRQPEGEIQPEVAESWRTAILRSSAYPPVSGARSDLRQVLAADPALAYDWLRQRWLDKNLDRHPYERVTKTAIEALESTARISMLDWLPPRTAAFNLVPLVVGDRLEVFRHLLSVAALADYHLRGLGGLPNKIWAEKARLALERGYSPRDIAHHTIWTPGHSHRRFDSQHWQEWIDAFAVFTQDPNPELVETVRCGMEMAGQELQKAADQKRGAELHGM